MQKLIERSFFEGTVGIENSNQGRMMHKLYAYWGKKSNYVIYTYRVKFQSIYSFFPEYLKLSQHKKNKLSISH